ACFALLLDEGEQSMLVEHSYRAAGAEVSLEGGDVGVVGTDGVRREVARDEQPANVLLARLTYLHIEPFLSVVVDHGASHSLRVRPRRIGRELDSAGVRALLGGTAALARIRSGTVSVEVEGGADRVAERLLLVVK